MRRYSAASVVSVLHELVGVVGAVGLVSVVALLCILVVPLCTVVVFLYCRAPVVVSWCIGEDCCTSVYWWTAVDVSLCIGGAIVAPLCIGWADVVVNLCIGRGGLLC